MQTWAQDFDFMKIILTNDLVDKLNIALKPSGFGADEPDGLDATILVRKGVGDGVYRHSFKLNGDDIQIGRPSVTGAPALASEDGQKSLGP